MVTSSTAVASFNFAALAFCKRAITATFDRYVVNAFVDGETLRERERERERGREGQRMKIDQASIHLTANIVEIENISLERS